MSAVAATLFAWLQDADFYRDMHFAAADTLTDGEGRSWLDVGCGPGILSRMAAEKGYSALGVDLDADMIAAARRLAVARRNSARFEVCGIEGAGACGERYDVVSASSLLVVLPDPAAALRQLIALAKPGGTVLIVEASAKMTRMGALRKILAGNLGGRAYMLLAWAMFRAGRALDDGLLDQPGMRVARFPLLDGLASANMISLCLA